MLRRVAIVGLPLAMLACGSEDAARSDDDTASPSICQPDSETKPAARELAPNEFQTSATASGRWIDPPLDQDLPIAIDLPIARYVGPRPVADYVQVHAIGKLARLDLRVSGTVNVDLEVLVSNAQTGNEPRPLETADHRPAVVPAVPDGALQTVSILFPTEQLALARTKGVPAPNRFTLHVKPRTEVAPPPSSRCPKTHELRVDWAAVDFYAQAPVVLVHGINDTPKNCWSDYAVEIEQLGFVPDLAVDFSGLGDKPGIAGGAPTYNGSVADDVKRIGERLARLTADYGTNQVHLIGHSKGGLDLVNFLAGSYAAMAAAGQVRVLSLQTLATPHAGSLLADIEAPLKQWAAQEGASGFTSWPLWGVVADDATDSDVCDTIGLSGIKSSVLEGDGPIDPGLSDLRTTSDAVRVDQEWAGDPKIPFAAYGWDADFERSRWVNDLAQLTSPPSSPDQGGKFSTDCRGNPTGSRRWTYYCIDEDEIDTFFWGTAVYPPNGTTCSGWNMCGSPLYRQLARGHVATVSSAHMLGGSRSTIHVEPYAPGEWVGNDLTVSLRSAAHPHANKVFAYAGEAPRNVDGLWRFKDGGGVEAYSAQCAHSGANHISILRHGRANMVACTAGDTAKWMQASAPVVDTPVPTR